MLNNLLKKKKSIDEFFIDIKKLTNKYQNFKPEKYLDSIRKKEEPKKNLNNINIIYSNSNIINSNGEINNINIKPINDIEVNKTKCIEDNNKIKAMDIDDEIDIKEFGYINNNIAQNENDQKENIKDLKTEQNNSIDNDESSDLFGDKFKKEMKAEMIEFMKTNKNQIQSSNPPRGKICNVNTVNKSSSTQNKTNQDFFKVNGQGKGIIIDKKEL